jgi:hypothetical protein
MAIENGSRCPFRLRTFDESPACGFPIRIRWGASMDFEKGEADASHGALPLIAMAADRLRSRLLP